MKKAFLMFIFLIGLLAVGCAPPGRAVKQDPVKTELIKAVDQQASAQFVMVAQGDNLPAPDTPVKWVDENFGAMLTGVLLSVYEFLALKIPTSKTLSLIGNLYKLLTFFFPDKNKNGGTFDIRDKL